MARTNTFELLKEKENHKDEIKNFIETSNKTLFDEEIITVTSLINQLIGYYNQVLVRSEAIMSKSEFTNYFNSYNNFLKRVSSTEKINNSKTKLDTLNEIYSDLINNYNNLNNYVLNIIENDVFIGEYNNLIKKANEVILSLNNIELDDSILEPLTNLYNKINNANDLTIINTFINEGMSLLTNNNNPPKGNKNERIFSLFAKINDQIIDSIFVNNNNLIYALYTLEDNSKYYAIIKNEKEIELLNQSFSNLPNLVLTKDNIINTCKIIIKNAGIYYDINEYMRYIEKSYKNKMTKEIDTLILKYKNRLKELENTIKMQLDFIDDIALIVNHKPCNKYPNITYSDISIEEYFPDNNLVKDSKLREINRLIVEVLLNSAIKSEFNTRSILMTLYDTPTLNSLLSNNYVKKSSFPSVNTSDNINNNLEITSNIKTNYEKIKDYLNIRLEELKLLDSSPKINVTITKDDNSIYKDINTVLDLHTAIIICDKVYKKGQGNYAVLDYLKTGNILKFTSKYQARDLAKSVSRNNYLKLLFENIFKRYLYSKDNHELNNFIEEILNKENININDLVRSLLENDKLLTDVINDFDYDYLDITKDKSIKIEELLKDNSDLTKTKINKILDLIKKSKNLID